MDKDVEIKNLRKQNEWLRGVNGKLEIENKHLDELYMRYATGEDYQKREREKLQKEYDKLLEEKTKLEEENVRLKEQILYLKENGCFNCIND